MLSINPTDTLQTTSPAAPLDLAIAAWLDAKANKSGSGKTLTAYRDTLADFRAALLSTGFDLDADPRAVSLTAQAWAGGSKVGRDVSPATFNQRLAVVSSFYAYARRTELLTGVNPIERIERRTTQAYASAVPLSAADVKRKLAAIDRSDVVGQRDYALLSVALSTGRRVTELASLQRGDLLIIDDKLTLTFRRAKGGKVMSDTLSASTSKAMIAYLYAAFGADFMTRPVDAPIWVSTSPRNAGRAVGAQTVADICEKHLGTSKVHTLRHTFAHSMEQAGAKVSDIQARLGHESHWRPPGAIWQA